MYGVELYSKVRMAVLRDGLSQRETARRFGIDSGTVSKMVGHAAPPGYRRARSRVRPASAVSISLFYDQLRLSGVVALFPSKALDTGPEVLAGLKLSPLERRGKIRPNRIR